MYTIIEKIIWILILIILGKASITDIKLKKIYNITPISIVLLTVFDIIARFTLTIIDKTDIIFVLSNVLISVIIITLGIISARKHIGGGDIKLFAAMTLFVGLSKISIMCFIGGCVILIVHIIMSIFSNVNLKTKRIPIAPAFFLGYIILIIEKYII